MKSDKKESETTNKPVDKVRFGSVEVCLWEKESTGNDGKPFMSQTFSFQKSYKDKEGNWQNTQVFQLNDILRLEHALKIIISRHVSKDKDTE